MLGVVVPAYNCNESVNILVGELQQHGFAKIIVIDDYSTPPLFLDGGIQRNVDVVRNNVNIGYSASVLRGMRLARSLGWSAIATIDGDGAHRVSDLARLSLALTSEAHPLVIGDRMRSISFEHLPTKRLANLISSSLTSACFGGSLTKGRDVSSGLRIYQPSFVDILAGKNHERFGLCYSSIHWAIQSGLSVGWYPIEVEYPPDQFQFTKRREFIDMLAQLNDVNVLSFDLSTVREYVLDGRCFNVVDSTSTIFALYLDAFDGYVFRLISEVVNGYPVVKL